MKNKLPSQIKKYVKEINKLNPMSLKRAMLKGADLRAKAEDKLQEEGYRLNGDGEWGLPSLSEKAVGFSLQMNRENNDNKFKTKWQFFYQIQRDGGYREIIYWSIGKKLSQIFKTLPLRYRIWCLGQGYSQFYEYLPIEGKNEWAINWILQAYPQFLVELPIEKSIQLLGQLSTSQVEKCFKNIAKSFF